jgi:hypothetical protein
VTAALATASGRAEIPLLLIVIAAAFLFVQHRLDERDPKLAEAPEHTEYVYFRPAG